jgi:hypothetical protein
MDSFRSKTIPWNGKASTDIIRPYCQFYQLTGLVFPDNGCLFFYLTGLSFVKQWMCFCQVAQAKLWHGHLSPRLVLEKKQTLPHENTSPI